MSEVKQKAVICLARWNKRVRCGRACSIVIIDDPECRELGNKLVAALQNVCPHKDTIKGKPQFGDPVEIKKEEIRREYGVSK